LVGKFKRLNRRRDDHSRGILGQPPEQKAKPPMCDGLFSKKEGTIQKRQTPINLMLSNALESRGQKDKEKKLVDEKKGCALCAALLSVGG